MNEHSPNMQRYYEFMHSTDNWDDLRYVLAVAEHGSVSATARTLGVNHATVLRHVAAFEARHNIELFEKTSRGYAVRVDRHQILKAVQEVESSVAAVERAIVERAIHGMQAPLRGVVRVTSTDTFCQAVLPDIVTAYQAQEGAIRIELISTSAYLDLSRLNADVAVRPTPELTSDLVGEVVAILGFDVFAPIDGSSDRWLAPTGMLTRSVAATWMTENVKTSKIAGAADSFLTLRELAASGIGQVILPSILGNSDRRLVRRNGILPDLGVKIWVASHADLSDVPRIRGVRRMLSEALSADADRLAGRV